MTTKHHMQAEIITRQCESISLVLPVKAHGICPACTSIHQINAKGLVVRHGWLAKNVRHGHHGGFHVGGHGSLPPIGTPDGNTLARTHAASNRATADHLEAQPPHTIEDATRAYLDHLSDREMTSWMNRWRVGPKPVRYATLDDLKQSRTWSAVQNWFNADGLASKAHSMDAYRAATIAGHREHADLLDSLVTFNPA